jgi:hypothetical protein
MRDIVRCCHHKSFVRHPCLQNTRSKFSFANTKTKHKKMSLDFSRQKPPEIIIWCSSELISQSHWIHIGWPNGPRETAMWMRFFALFHFIRNLTTHVSYKKSVKLTLFGGVRSFLIVLLMINSTGNVLKNIRIITPSCVIRYNSMVWSTIEE